MAVKPQSTNTTPPQSPEDDRDITQTYDFRTWRDITPLHSSVGTMLHNKTGSWRFIRPIYEDKIPACQNSCPTGNDIESWMKLLAQGQYDAAYWRLKREEPFPAILGRVCFKFCEGACNRGELDQSISIKELERYLGDAVSPQSPHPHMAESNGRQIAVVGSGPAGMAVAYFGRLLGFGVTIFEALPELGGILRYGIPDYRLEPAIVAKEFEALAEMEVRLQPNTTIGKDIAFDALADEFDYIFLATGAHKSLRLGLEAENDCPGVMSGLALLKQVAAGNVPELGGRVAVIGGGNTAIDAARTAVRLGNEVTIVYRRSESEMPAHAEEVQAAREEGVTFQFLTAPTKLTLNSEGAIEQLICCEMTLGPEDTSGRRRPVPKPDSELQLTVDAVITAIGEAPECDCAPDGIPMERGALKAEADLAVLQLNGTKVFAGGDVADQPRTVVHALSSGKRAAISMDCDRNGIDFRSVVDRIAVGHNGAISFGKYMELDNLNPVRRDDRAVVGPDRIGFDYFVKVPRKGVAPQGAEERRHSFAPYQQTLPKIAAHGEAARCLHCGRCTQCDNCLVFCPDVSVHPEPAPSFGYRIDYDYCKGCGICATECPRNAITMISETNQLDEEA